MSWNYRVTRESHADGELFAIREVYYDDAGKPTGWSRDPIGVVGDTAEDVAAVLAQMATALTRGVLDLDEAKST